ncbi:Crp/Fnr family transcriptional regulator [Propionivibrio sp.]|uniref:Crp/Fnr family transcriptional regulator n=1 Tax=Propionivibrio sp. TaxID=2212460 RepID=UPI003BF03F53
MAKPQPYSLKKTDARQEQQSFAAGQAIYTHSTSGAAWRVLSGSVRLDRLEPNGEQNFANLAIKGDIIGAETLLFDSYSFTATALTPCLLTPWPEGCSAPAGDSLLHNMAKAERRAADVIALRCGQAAERVRRLVFLLAAPGEASGEGYVEAIGEAIARPLQVTLPPRQDMADITALTLETVSRMVSGLRRAGILKPLSTSGGVSTSRFSLAAIPLDLENAG